MIPGVARVRCHNTELETKNGALLSDHYANGANATEPHNSQCPRQAGELRLVVIRS
jgi:hypothetical protein